MGAAAALAASMTALGPWACAPIVSSGDITGDLQDKGASSTTSEPSGGGGGAGAQGGGGSGGGAVDPGTACLEPVVVKMDPGTVTLMGTTSGRPAVKAPATEGPPQGPPLPLDCPEGAAGPELIYRVELLSHGFLTARLTPSGTSFDSMLYVRAQDDCDAAEASIVCADRAGGAGEVTSLRGKKNESFYLFVDGKTAADAGDFELELDLSPGATCTGSSPVPIVLEPGSTMKFLGHTEGGADDVACPDQSGSGTEDIVYAFSPKGIQKAIKVSAIGKASEIVLLASAACPPLELTCSGKPVPGGDALLETDLDYVWVDIAAGSPYGLYAMTVTVP